MSSQKRLCGSPLWRAAMALTDAAGSVYGKAFGSTLMDDLFATIVGVAASVSFAIDEPRREGFARHLDDARRGLRVLGAQVNRVAMDGVISRGSSLAIRTTARELLDGIDVALYRRRAA